MSRGMTHVTNLLGDTVARMMAWAHIFEPRSAVVHPARIGWLKEPALEVWLRLQLSGTSRVAMIHLSQFELGFVQDRRRIGNGICVALRCLVSNRPFGLMSLGSLSHLGQPDQLQTVFARHVAVSRAFGWLHGARAFFRWGVMSELMQGGPSRQPADMDRRAIGAATLS